MRKLLPACVVTFVALVSALVVAEERPDQSVFWKIRQEGSGNSQILRTLHMLTDVHGPRLTGSPNLKAAGDWAIQQLHAWGLKNGHLDPWNFGYAGWATSGLPRISFHRSKTRWSPRRSHGHPAPRRGEGRGVADHAATPADPRGLTAFLDSLKAYVTGKMVLVNAPQQVSVSFNPAPLRREDSDVITQMNPPQPAAGRVNGRPSAQAGQGSPGRRTPAADGGQVEEQLNAFLVASGSSFGLTMPGGNTGRSARSTIGPTTSRKHPRWSSCATRTTGESGVCWTTSAPSNSSSTS